MPLTEFLATNSSSLLRTFMTYFLIAEIYSSGIFSIFSISLMLLIMEVTAGGSVPANVVSYKLSSSSLFCSSIHLKHYLISRSRALSLSAFRSPYFCRYPSIVSIRFAFYSFIQSSVSSRFQISSSSLLFFYQQSSKSALFLEANLFRLSIMFYFVEILDSSCLSRYLKCWMTFLELYNYSAIFLSFTQRLKIYCYFLLISQLFVPSQAFFSYNYFFNLYTYLSDCFLYSKPFFFEFQNYYIFAISLLIQASYQRDFQLP